MTSFETTLAEDNADELLNYFGGPYSGTFRHKARRRNPLFSISLRNMFNRTKQELPGTNNSVESWQRSFRPTTFFEEHF